MANCLTKNANESYTCPEEGCDSSAQVTQQSGSPDSGNRGDYCSVFQGESDVYHGITVDSTKEGCCEEEFEKKLQDSLLVWLSTGVRGLWFKVATADAHWVPVLAKSGFEFHHAQPGYVMMTKWLPDVEKNNLPAYAHTYIGVGGLVIDENNKILVLKERFMKKPHWKLPGGLVEIGEGLPEAVQREVLEETGIHTEFLSVIAFRHLHDYRFTCSDIYFVCHMKPMHHEEHIKRQTQEISDARWIELEEYVNFEDIAPVNRFVAQALIKEQSLGCGIKSSFVSSRAFHKLNRVYSVLPLGESEQTAEEVLE